ncbi:MAG: acetylglutamate kinase [Planctomycetota bacterium]|nr:MAG: acetylglutamate kinase [Planctomycetota bacterium]
MNELLRAAAHVRLHRGRTFVVKIGGACVERPPLLRQLARQISAVQALGARLVVVHGGGPQTDALQRLLGEEPAHVDGRRVTSATALRALRLATAGELNSAIAAALTAEGAPAVGMCAASAGVLTAARRPPQPRPGGALDFGEVGDIRQVNPAPILSLLRDGWIPVLCPPASDGQGGFLNVNADLAAAALAVALSAAKLVLLTGAPGVLRDPADPGSLVSALSLPELEQLEREGALQNGMAVKSAAIRAALQGGVPRVHVVSGTEPEALLRELYTNHGAGTLLTLEPDSAPVLEAAS